MRIIPNPDGLTFDGFDLSAQGILAAVVREQTDQIRLYDYLGDGSLNRLLYTGPLVKDIISRPVFSPDGKYLFAVGFSYGERGVLYCWDINGPQTPTLVLPLSENLNSDDFFVGETQDKYLIAVSVDHTRSIHVAIYKTTRDAQITYGAKVQWLAKTGEQIYIPPGDTRSMAVGLPGGRGQLFKIPFCCENVRPVNKEAVLLLNGRESDDEVLLTRVELASGKRTVWNLCANEDNIVPAMTLSDDGKQMALVMPSELWFMPVPAPGHGSPLTPTRVLDLKQHIEWVIWAPDGLTVTVQGAQGLITVDVDE